MKQQTRNLLMWVLYTLLFLAVMLAQTAVFGRLRFFGVKLSLLPVVLACVSLHVGNEAGAIYSLLACLLWCLSGADSGATAIVTGTVIGTLAGYLCDAVYARKLVPAIFISFGALLIYEGAAFLLKVYFGSAALRLWYWIPVQCVLSVPAVLVLYPVSKLIRKAGAA